jgi:hypothetical protein
MTRIKNSLLALLLALTAPYLAARQSPPETGQPPAEPGSAAGAGLLGSGAGQAEMDLPAVVALLREQAALLAEARSDLKTQAQLLESQRLEISVLRQEVDALRVPVAGVAASSQPVAPLPEVAEKMALEEKSVTERKAETGRSVSQAQVDDPARELLSEFPGAWRVPGTSAALGIGGYVKSTIVLNKDPLEIRDRFIVGSIPLDNSLVQDLEAQSSVTASQSRLNFDLREPTPVGVLRAFIEGDFAGEGESFRLRHAFGQWNRVLAGKTWSAFVDTEASPEEVDFEGLNGRINVRQSQVRVMPRYGEEFEFQLSLEDPNPKIDNGTGVNRNPDIVLSGRFQPNPRLHVKVGLLGREIRAQSIDGEVEKEFAWGASVSGRFTTPLLDERDSLLFQLNAGNGIGRYVNDLSSVGNFDGVFEEGTGRFELFDIKAGYVSWQHWWGGTMRSNFTFGMVDVSNPGWIEGDAYKRTTRASANLLWTPTPRIDLGFEFLWGRRENEDGNDGDATQLQLAARYRF